MRQSTRLIINTASTYVRMSVTIALGLVTTRLMVKALGFDDFGISTVLGASSGLIFMISYSLGRSSMRHLAFAIGQGDHEGLDHLFSTIRITLSAMGLGLMLVLWGISWPLVHVLEIPTGRVFAAWIVVCSSGCTMAIAFTSAAYRALFMAYQRITLLEILNTCWSIILLTESIILLMYPYDRLILLAIMNMAQSSIMLTALFMLYRRYLPRRSISLKHYSFTEMRRLFSYAMWSFFGQMAWYVRMQLSQIIVNLVYGPVANSAFGLGSQLANYAIPLGSALNRAAQPAAATLLGREDKNSIRRLAIFTSKTQPIMISLLLVPLMLDTPFLLHLWIGDYPEISVVLARFILPWAWITDLTSGIDQAYMAREKVGKYSLVGLICETSGLAIAAVLVFTLPSGPIWIIPALSLAAAIAQAMIRVIFYGEAAYLNLASWAKTVLGPVLLATVPAFGLALLVHEMTETGWVRLSSIVAVYTVVLGALFWMLTLDSWERGYFKPIFGKLKSKLFRR